MEFLRTQLNRITRNFNHLSMNSDPTPTEAPWTTHDANLALYSALTQPSSLREKPRPVLPPEIVLQILEHPTRLILTSYVSLNDIREHGIHVYSDRSPLRVLSSQPLSADNAKKIRKVVFEFRGKDQGWSNYHSDHGTYNNTWSWYEAVVQNMKVEGDQNPVEVSRFELQRNRHAGQQPERYRIEFGKEHPLVSGLKQGDVLALDACAAFPGWQCQVNEARIEVWGVDDLSMGKEMEWIDYSYNDMLSGRWMNTTLADEIQAETEE